MGLHWKLSAIPILSFEPGHHYSVYSFFYLFLKVYCVHYSVTNEKNILQYANAQKLMKRK